MSPESAKPSSIGRPDWSPLRFVRFMRHSTVIDFEAIALDTGGVSISVETESLTTEDTEITEICLRNSPFLYVLRAFVV